MRKLRRIGRVGLGIGLLALGVGGLLVIGSALIAGDWYLAPQPWIGLGLDLLVLGLAVTAILGVVEATGPLALAADPRQGDFIGPHRSTLPYWTRAGLARSTPKPKAKEECVMRRLLVACALAVSLVWALGGSALASNHRKVSSECAAAAASAVANGQEPVGLTPDGGTALFFNGTNPATGSDLRSVIATGIVLVDDNGFFVGLDLTRPALNGNSGVEHCPNV